MIEKSILCSFAFLDALLFGKIPERFLCKEEGRAERMGFVSKRSLEQKPPIPPAPPEYAEYGIFSKSKIYDNI
jgi:hypothetical protein